MKLKVNKHNNYIMAQWCWCWCDYFFSSLAAVLLSRILRSAHNSVIFSAGEESIDTGYFRLLFKS